MFLAMALEPTTHLLHNTCSTNEMHCPQQIRAIRKTLVETVTTYSNWNIIPHLGRPAIFGPCFFLPSDFRPPRPPIITHTSSQLGSRDAVIIIDPSGEKRQAVKYPSVWWSLKPFFWQTPGWLRFCGEGREEKRQWTWKFAFSSENQVTLIF